jgi:hypothetical protein
MGRPIMKVESETHTLPPDEALADDSPPETPGVARLYRRVELLSAIMLSLATIATAWSGYQSARWGGERTRRAAEASAAIVKTGQFANLAEQKAGLHVNLFGQWAAAVSTGNQALADFLFDRFPEPLKTATVAWRATQPLTNPSAPATPFEMPEYALAENAEAQRWEAISAAESDAAEHANDISDRYLLFTIIFASVLFFGGISGKFRWQVIDVAVLAFGALALLAGLAVLFSTPVT